MTMLTRINMSKFTGDVSVPGFYKTLNPLEKDYETRMNIGGKDKIKKKESESDDIHGDESTWKEKESIKNPVIEAINPNKRKHLLDTNIGFLTTADDIRPIKKVCAFGRDDEKIPEVWSRALRIESADIYALPYVILY